MPPGNWDYREALSTGGWIAMAFKNFRLNVIVRIIIFTIILTALIYCLMNGLYLRSIYIFIGFAISIGEFVHYVEKSNRDLTSFLLAIMQNDFTSTYSEQGKGRSFSHLYQAFNQITDRFRLLSEDKEAQYRYLELLVEHVRVGIISFDEKEQIHLINNTMKKLLSSSHAHSLKGIEGGVKGFVEAARTIIPGENRLVKIQQEGKVIPLTLHASEFTLLNKYYKLISAQDIRTELEANELEAWQKLIRVLTHEIMNSISPVISLSGTLHKMVASRKSAQKALEAKDQESLEQGLDAIRSRSEALQNFTNAYRSLTRIPQPQFRSVKVVDLFRHLNVLFTNEIGEKKISLHVIQPSDAITVFVDSGLVQQVLINIFKNALDAVQNSSHPSITLSAHRENNQVAIQLKDNGAGIPGEILDSIFIPFFTTKKNGSGIGLAFSKQIIQLHRGRIHVETAPEAGTVVTIVL
jgi:nitrogen fixation/metabolism regulation signal transduction histidine kinase